MIAVAESTAPSAALQFLRRLDPEHSEFTFQTFDDTSRKRNSLARVMHGALDSVAPELRRLQDDRAGAFVTVNVTDGNGRQEQNIVAVRAVFVDLDGAPLGPVVSSGLDPHIVVESSAGRYHAYWLVDDCPLDQFEVVQRALATRFGGDTSVHDLPRVMRLPGYTHYKGDPQVTKIIPDLGTSEPPYKLAEIVSKLSLDLKTASKSAVVPLIAENGKIAPGGRHAHLFALARSLAQRGTLATVRAALEAENTARCTPPLLAIDLDYLAGRAFTAKHSKDWPRLADDHEPTRAEEYDDGPPPIEEQSPPVPALAYINWSAFEARGTPPPRQWLVSEWIGEGHTTLLAGVGGIGKSVVAQQFATAVAAGCSFIANAQPPREVLMWAGEDDADELDRRQISICKAFDISRSSLSGSMFVYPMHDVECSLFDISFGAAVRTSMLKVLREQVGDLRARLVVLDNIARLFGGNENDRHHVSMFMSALAWATQPTQAGILLIGHISKFVGSEFSGSTAWENAARARLFLGDSKPDAKKSDSSLDEGDAPTDLRYLSKRKVNYTTRDLCILRYIDGAYEVVQAPGGGIVAKIDRDNCRRVVLRALARLSSEPMNFTCSDSAHGSHYLPRLILDHKMAEGFTKRDLADAMHTLVIDGEIIRQVEKSSNRSTDRIRLLPKPIGLV